MEHIIDLRSDTVTKPTQKMREAMMNAEVGDDVFGDDPTVNQLESYAAELLGKEKALFVPSGTMGNQICVNVQTNAGDEIILQEDHHIFKYEVGAVAALSSVQCKTLKSHNGLYNLDELKHAIRENNIHYPKTRLICVENTHNMQGGVVIPTAHMQQIRSIADEHDLRVHLDGARIFHAAISLGCSAEKIASYADTVMFCLSKGLASPVGSMIAGDSALIEQARVVRKRFGGGMRQVGVLAACGLISLTDMLERLPQDHNRAQELAEGISHIEGYEIDLKTVQTNIVIFSISSKGPSAASVVERLKQHGVLAIAVGSDRIRMIPHYEISDDDINQTIEILKKIK